MTSLVECREQGRSQRLYKIFEPYLVQRSKNRQPSWRNVPNSLMVYIQYGCGRHTEFQTINISTVDEDISIILP